MRDPERIPEILNRLRTVWEKHPDLRLGQLIENVFPNTDFDQISGRHLECEEYIRTIEDYYAQNPVFRRFGPKKVRNQNE